MNPKHPQQVFRVSLFVEEAVLAQVLVLEHRLASMDLGLEVLAIPENIQELLRRFEAKHLSQIALGVVHLLEVVVSRHLVVFVESVNDLRNSHAQVPDYLRSAVSLVLKLSYQNRHDLPDVLVDLVFGQDTRL